MKSYEQAIDEIYQKANAQLLKKKQHKKAIKKAITCVMPMCLILTVLVSTQIEMIKESSDPSDVGTDNMPEINDLPVSIDMIVCGGDDTDTDDASMYIYTDWNGLDISTELAFTINNIDERYYAINVFRRNHKNYFEDFIYEGMTIEQYVYELDAIALYIEGLNELLGHYGEILKYEKGVLTTTGVPTDDPSIVYEKGEIWPEWRYDELIAYFNNIDPEMLSKYIVDGVFLSFEAEQDLDMYRSSQSDILKMIEDSSRAYFSLHEVADVDLFRKAGLVCGEVNGKLYIIVTRSQLETLSNKEEFSSFSYTCLLYEDLLAAYPND